MKGKNRAPSSSRSKAAICYFQYLKTFRYDSKEVMLQPRLSGAIVRCVAPGKGRLSIHVMGIRCNSRAALSRGQPDISEISNQPDKRYPLAAMPTEMLLRSLFILTVSSNRFLLIPSLRLLSFFAKPDRGFFFNVDRNPVLKAILKKTLYKQFCAGETERETKACVKQLKAFGFKGVILTFAKETVFDHRSKSADLLSSEKPVGMAATCDVDIEAWRVGTLKTVDLISEGDFLALRYISLLTVLHRGRHG